MHPSHGRLLILIWLFLSIVPPARSEPPRTDAYGDPLPKHARFRLGTVRLRHTNIITSLAWLPDGCTLATAGDDGIVRLWQIQGGKQIAQWNKIDRREDVRFSPDGRIAACGGKDREIRLVDAATGKELRRLSVAAKSRHFPSAFSPDGKSLAVDEWQESRGLYEWTKRVRLYALDSGKEIRHLPGTLASERTQAFSPDGRTLAVSSSNRIDCWNLRTGAKSSISASGKVNAVVFAPEGKRLAAVIGSPEQVRFVSLRSWPAGEELQRFPCENRSGTASIAFSPDGKHVAVHDGNIHLYDAATSAEVRRFQGDGIPGGLAFSRNGALLASTGADSVATVWEVRKKGTASPLTGMSHRLDAVAGTTDGRVLLSHSRDGSLILWDGRDGRRMRTLALGESAISKLLLSPDGKRAVELHPAVEAAPSCWDVANGRRLPAFSGNTPTLNCAAFSPDSSLLALCDFGGVIHLRGTIQGGEIGLLRNEESASSATDLVFSPDGKTLAAAYIDGRLILWDMFTHRPHRCALQSSHSSAGRLAFSADSRLLAELGSDKKTIRLIETASRKKCRSLRISPVPIGVFAFAPDNRTLAIGDAPFESKTGFADCAIRLWDWPGGKPGPVLHGHRGNIHTLFFSADGASLVSGSDDETILCWDIAELPRRRPASKEISSARLTELWRELADKDAGRGQRAVCELIMAGDSALPFLAKSLPPVPRTKMAHLAELIADLDGEEFVRRDRAAKELRTIGEPAVSALRKVLTEKPTLEVRKRITAILETIDESEISPRWLRSLRVLQALEAIGTAKAREILEALARGAPEAGLTQEAKAALARMHRRSNNR